MRRSAISFHGGVGTVTGSRFLVEAKDRRILVDAGLFQGLKELRLRNWDRPAFAPASIDAVLLTHAHIDHSGYLPRLVRQGFAGPVYATDASVDLARVLLLDAAKIQEEDAAYANRKGFSKHRPALPLYTTEDAETALALLRPVDFGAWLDLGGGVRARFHPAGHILGAASIEMIAPTEGGARRIVFSGDVGRYGVPLHADPLPRPRSDALVLESTYGDRSHDPRPVDEQLVEPLRRTFARGGTVLVPSFAVGRAQLVTLILRELINRGALADVTIHIDSPMAVDATRIYSRHLHDPTLDDELVEDGRTRLFPRNVRLHRTVEESKALNELAGPRIVISASGMLSGGRVLHHLKRLAPDPKNLVMLVGYQAAGTRGRAMLEGAPTIKIHGEAIPVRAERIALHGLSAHADRDELLRWVRSASTPPAVTFVTHGEPPAARALAARLGGELSARCVVPSLGDVFPLAEIDAAS